MDRQLYTFKEYLKETYPYKVRKIPLHAHLGCPHKDPGTGTGGCLYCYIPGFSRATYQSIHEQIEKGLQNNRDIEFHGKSIAYFQTETNTNAEISTLKNLWMPVLEYPDKFVGISISTRPDCIKKGQLDLLNNFHRQGYTVWIELGLQSIHDETLKRMNRGHDYKTFLDAVHLIRSYPFRMITHLILGLPGETGEHMKATILAINNLPVHGLKFHHLQIVKNTVLAEWYHQNKISVYSPDEYINLLLELIPFVSPEKIIHRLFGNIHDNYLIAPKWTMSKPEAIYKFRKALNHKNLYQGCKIKK